MVITDSVLTLPVILNWRVWVTVSCAKAALLKNKNNTSNFFMVDGDCNQWGMITNIKKEREITRPLLT